MSILSYKWWWSRFGKRPWTFIWRDLYHSTPYVIQFLWFNIGLWIGLEVGWKFAYIFWAIYTLGFIEGHFHWGTKYISNQQG